VSVRSKDSVLKLVNDFLLSISSQYKIKEVYLYGSFAKGTALEYSDIDIAIILSEECNHEKRFEIFSKAQSFSCELEPVVYSEEEFNEYATTLVSIIHKEGELIAS